MSGSQSAILIDRRGKVRHQWRADRDRTDITVSVHLTSARFAYNKSLHTVRFPTVFHESLACVTVCPIHTTKSNWESSMQRFTDSRFQSLNTFQLIPINKANIATARNFWGGSNNLAIHWWILKIRWKFQTCFNISYSLIIDHLISYNDPPTQKYEVHPTRVLSGCVMYSLPKNFPPPREILASSLSS
jgi:hypothetical protein